MNQEVLQGDCREVLGTLPERHFQTCVTSPPYYGLRDYGVDGQIGQEPTLDEFVQEMVEVFRAVRRVLRDDGVLWLNLGDTYEDGTCGRSDDHRHELDGYERQTDGRTQKRRRSLSGLKPKNLMGVPWRVALALQADGWWLRDAIIWHKPTPMPTSQVDRCTNAYEFVFQLTKSPRYFFDEIPLRTPLSVKTLTVSTIPTKSAAEPSGNDAGQNLNRWMAEQGGRRPQAVKTPDGWKVGGGTHGTIHDEGRSKGEPDAAVITSAKPRNVWRIAAEPCKDAHFATYPTALVERCLRLSTSELGACSVCGAPYQRVTDKQKLTRERPNELTKRTGDEGTGNHCANTVAGVSEQTIGWRGTCDCLADFLNPLPGDLDPCRVLDPFNGAGTTGIACRRLGLNYTGIELSAEYVELTHKRWRREANRGAKLPKPHEDAEGQMPLFAEEAAG